MNSVFLANASVLNDLYKVIILKIIPQVIQGPKIGKYSLKLMFYHSRSILTILYNEGCSSEF